MHYILKHGNAITLVRGDCLEQPIELKTGRFPYDKKGALEEGDYAYFGVMKPNQPFEKAEIKKEFTWEDMDEDNNLVLRLDPEDTMGMLPGTYYFEVKVLYKKDGDNHIHLDTAVPKAMFTLID